MLSDRALSNFETYLACTPKRDLGRSPYHRNPLGAYDSKRGGHGVDVRHFGRGGALDFEGETVEKLLAFLRGKGFAPAALEKVKAMLIGNSAAGAEDDTGEMAAKVREWAEAKGLRPDDCAELLEMIGMGEAGDEPGETQLRRNREQLDNREAMDGFRRQTAGDAAALAAFQKTHGLDARSVRVLGGR